MPTKPRTDSQREAQRKQKMKLKRKRLLQLEEYMYLDPSHIPIGPYPCECTTTLLCQYAKHIHTLVRSTQRFLDDDPNEQTIIAWRRAADTHLKHRLFAFQTLLENAGQKYAHQLAQKRKPIFEAELYKDLDELQQEHTEFNQTNQPEVGLDPQQAKLSRERGTVQGGPDMFEDKNEAPERSAHKVPTMQELEDEHYGTPDKDDQGH